MAPTSTPVEAPPLSPQELMALKNKRAGLAIFQISWILVFVVLIWANFALRGQAESWPPPGVERLNALIPTVSTALLIISGLTARAALTALKAGQMEGFLRAWRGTLALGAVFVAFMVFEWLTVPISGQYSNLFRVMVAFHAVHALAIGAYLWNIHQQRARYNPVHFWPVEAGVGLWYFVVVAWLLFYAVLYII